MKNKWDAWREDWMDVNKDYAETAIRDGMSCDEALAKFEETITFPTETSSQVKDEAMVLGKATIEYTYLQH